MNIAMSTHEFIKELIDSGLTERQAEVIARHQTAVINESLATKQDVALLKQDIELLKKDLLLKLGSVMVGG
ncbi:MAG: CCDC90 family protein, partial [Gammaproteobacteria bacterium]|nr:CCDC90 family protein [Alphaproteobacteria bacterium]MDA8011086.1 CCDC90 family protein [Gammaproteobacteria bacterium]